MKRHLTLAAVLMVVLAGCASPHNDDMGDVFGGAIAGHIKKGQ